MQKVNFVTSNRAKFKEVYERLSVLNIDLIQLEIDMEEKRTFEILEIAKYKLKQAKLYIGNKKEMILVDDRGFFIDALNGFPGPFVKLLLNSIKMDGLIRLMDPFQDRKARFTTVLGFYDGNKDYYFQSDEEGFITEKVREGDTRGWTNLLRVYSYEKFPNKALSQLSDMEWKSYLDIVEEKDNISEFMNFYRKNYS